MIKKKIKSYYKNFRSKVFERIHGKIRIRKNFSSIVDILQINDPKIRSFENKKYNVKSKDVKIEKRVWKFNIIKFKN